VVTRFYELVAAELSTRLTSAILWKHVGDEVLFYKRVTGNDDLCQCLPAAHSVLAAVISVLHSTYPDTKTILSVKGTVWVATAVAIPPGDIETVQLLNRNIIISTGRLPDSIDRDFIGPDIDAGFRLSKFVDRSRLIVSAGLACLLFRERGRCKKIDERLKIVAYDKLRGVWDDRYYPIIWYENDWRTVNETFLYDEHITSETIKNIKHGLNDGNDLKHIEQIFVDLGREQEINELALALEAAKSDVEDTVPIEVPKSKLSEVHCVAVCIADDGRVLVGRRPTTKKRFPNRFEFGCGQLQIGQSFSECLKKSYQEDFHIELDLPDNPIPLSTFIITDKEERRSIPGIIFLAPIKNSHGVSEHFVKEKHSEIRWIDPTKLESLVVDEYIPDFKETIKAAYGIWKRNRPPTTSRKR
jgi:hypothetical protein